MSRYRIDQASKEYLTGLRGKTRAKMVYAIHQADIEADHSLALFLDHLRTRKPAIDAAITIANDQLAKFAKQFAEYVEDTYANLQPLVAPYKVQKRSYPITNMRYDFYDNILADAEWGAQREAETAMRTVLAAFRATLSNSTPKALALTPEEKVEITNAVSTTRLLAASTGTENT